MMSSNTVRATASFSRSWIEISESILITDARKFVAGNPRATRVGLQHLTSSERILHF